MPEQKQSKQKNLMIIIGFVLLILALGYKSLVPILIRAAGVETDARVVRKWDASRRSSHEYFIEYEFMVDGQAKKGVSEISQNVFGYHYEGSTWQSVSYDKSAVDPVRGVDMKRVADSYLLGKSAKLKVKYISAMPELNILSSPIPEIDMTYLYIAGAVLAFFLFGYLPRMLKS